MAAAGSTSTMCGDAGWRTTFEDNFPPGKPLNSSVWTPRDNMTHGDAEQQLYLSDEVTVDEENGLLVLTTRKREAWHEGRRYEFTSGWVDTSEKMFQQFGRFEVRARLPDPTAGADGWWPDAWPAIWLMPNPSTSSPVDVCWPVGGEIDVMEGYSPRNVTDPLMQSVYQTFHWATECGEDLWDGESGLYPPANDTATRIDWTDFHTFTVEWEESSLKWFIDGELRYERHAGEPASLKVPASPFYLILNTAMNPWSNSTRDSGFPVTFEIDRVTWCAFEDDDGDLPAPANDDDVATLTVLPDVVLSTSPEFRFTSVNFDFWPSTKDKWSSGGALNVDLSNPDLQFLAKQLSGSMLRLGGSPADFLLYETEAGMCSEERLNKTQPDPESSYFCPIWDQTDGLCLTMGRWREINQFALDAGLQIAMDLNACWGRNSSSGEMDMTMISGLIKATAAFEASAVYAFEFGNELYSNVQAERYGSDMIAIANMISKTEWNGSSTPPRLVGPDNGWEDMGTSYADEMLTACDGTLHALTFHLYGACNSGANLSDAVLNATCLDHLAPDVVAKFGETAKRHGVELWNGEGAMQGNSGAAGATNAFQSSFWYVNTLASLATHNVTLLSRQTLVGGDYELINKTTFKPNPDYWSLLLWRTLIGDTARDVSFGGSCEADCAAHVRGYAFESTTASTITVIIINLSTRLSFDVNIAWTAAVAGEAAADPMGLYQLTADALSSSTVLLNGNALTYNGDGKLSALTPLPVAAGSTLSLPSASISFVTSSVIL